MNLDWLSCELQKCNSIEKKIACLDQKVHVPAWARCDSTPIEALILRELVAMGQLVKGQDIAALIKDLEPVERFYQEMGGLVGYQALMLRHISGEGIEEEPQIYQCPTGRDLFECNSQVESWVADGIDALPHLAELYPVGGAADRLRLVDPVSQVPMPAACLQFQGKTLLEWLIEDLQAREYLYYQKHGRQVVTPIAMMTSSEKDNHAQILKLCEEKRWFGRPKSSFFLFCQPLVPVVNRQGNWVMGGAGRLLLKPGGHGAIWKLAKDQGVFQWLKGQGRHQILVRQINNPIAGADYGLLAFSGIGWREKKAFGFASCQRQIHAAEGMNVLVQQGERQCLTSVEYCDFTRKGIEDVPMEEGSIYSKFPSNTNVLFADIDAISSAVDRMPLPGMIVNFKKIAFVNAEGELKEEEMARLESTMQNIADVFDASQAFLTYHHRRKTISTIKKEWDQVSPPLETAEGCLWDMYCNAHELLETYCQFSLPPLASFGEGPRFQMSYHPSLGPIYATIGRKLRRGRLAEGSTLCLKIAQLDAEDLDVSGHLTIEAVCPMGHLDEEGKLCYSDRGGACVLRRVRVAGRCEIILHEGSSFEAVDVEFASDVRIEVLKGEHLRISR